MKKKKDFNIEDWTFSLLSTSILDGRIDAETRAKLEEDILIYGKCAYRIEDKKVIYHDITKIYDITEG